MNTASYLNHWLSHRNALVNLIDKVDNEHTVYEPWNGAMSLGHLVVHIVQSTDMFVESVKQGTFAEPTIQDDFQTMDDVRKIVRDATEKTKNDLEALTEEQVNSMISSPIMEAPGSVYLTTSLDHEIHHKGQLFTYARMAGIEDMPMFIAR
ncbi:damage-inducible protein DinB [Bacillaceae bacterium SIJ1]|uniref:DinB family protein n=1 Tax=Litoribacterium kuwaitense TaxID=1398745 RepID=UPI0013EB97BD|nr:DinB family protein [Litoribacterium kuwaitense]NGP46499.1 damage-inducible protein DinB [Litoribacterium kuwaitense]